MPVSSKPTMATGPTRGVVDTGPRDALPADHNIGHDTPKPQAYRPSVATTPPSGAGANAVGVIPDVPAAAPLASNSI